MIKPEILQGTDGIRGKIGTNELDDPVQYFIETHILTPGFFHVYAYAYACVLLETKAAKPFDKVILGQDPRDPEGVFLKAFTEGVLKAGLNVVDIGILPTPAIPQYMILTNASGCAMLTASHNPSDQHGIKLFHKDSGLKFLPGDDKILTQGIYNTKFTELNDLHPIGIKKKKHKKGKDAFITFCLSSENSWIQNDMNFRQIYLVVDASNGAMGTIVKDIFSKLDFEDVIYTNMGEEGQINENCGVADLEGRSFINKSDVFGLHASFKGYETLETMFHLAEEIQEIQKGRRILIGIVFDGDGDRCYRLDYDVKEGNLRVSNGDSLSYFQSRRLKDNRSKNHPTIATTVESDLMTLNHLKRQGWNTEITAVGDKWIQFFAFLTLIDQVISLDGNNQTQNKLEEQKETSLPSGLEISSIWRYLNCNLKLRNLELRNLDFQIGYEESGHCITVGVISQSVSSHLVFLGNGIKTALNVLVALETIRLTKGNQDYYQTIKFPFEKGIDQTYYIYYVDKHRLHPDKVERDQIIQNIENIIEQNLIDGIRFELKIKKEEMTMLYWEITKEGQKIGAVFVRNSGTEDKSSISLRGDRKYKLLMDKIGNAVHYYLLKILKKQTSEEVKFTRSLINSLGISGSIETVLIQYAHLPVKRILREMEMKEKLIEKNNEMFILTKAGRCLYQFWNLDSNL